jgi:hypothetical protein
MSKKIQPLGWKPIGMTRAKPQRLQRKTNNIFYLNLAFFAPWREESPSLMPSMMNL